LDFGSGVGSSGAAALDVFGVGRSSNAPSSNHDAGGIDWIHSIDASQCMRETTEKVLKSILEGSPWIDETSSNTANLNRLEEEEALLLAEYERMLFNDDGDSTNRERKRIERRRKMMERWDQSWERRADARTRLTFGESIVDSSSTVSTSSRPTGRNSRGAYSSDRETDDESNHRRLPWQDKLDEQRRRVTEQKYNSQQDQQKNKGSFDLILCSYTLTELPSVPASLAAATLLWEKLAPNGVLVIVEPGTPDGFGMLRSVRSMLLECCPPPEVRMKRKKMKVEPITSIDEKEGIDTYTLNGLLTEKDSNEDDDTWPEECHVIAPCTHNGTCPMSRHQKNHIKRNARFSRYESAEPKDQDSDDEVRDDARKTDEDDDDEEMSFQELLDEWDNMPEGQKDELKIMLGGGDDMSDDEAKAMLEYMESMDSDEEEDDDEGEDDDSDSDHDSDSLETDGVDYEQDYYNIDEGSSKNDEPSSNKEKNPSTMAKTDVFGSSFCSFVHTFPGGTTRRKGEKFAYLVVQKRVPVLDESLNSNKNSNKHCPTTVHTENLESLNEVDIVEMLSKSVHHAQKLKREELAYRLRQRRYGGGNDDNVDVTNNIELDENPTYSYHMNQSNTLLQRAVDVEDKFLESTIDKLGLELLHGDDQRRSWGRLIRAPLKKKGHVLIDYCSVGCGGGCSVSTTDDDNGGTQGRITRQKISRGWSARAAPGCYSAARKARWGGLWPDISERVKRIDFIKDDELKKRIKSQNI
jgi:ribosomal protein RSM22 (predicted rRNA methylase)